MLAPSPASEPRYTAFPRVCDIDKNALGQASAIDMKGCEDELAAAEVCKLLIEKVAEEEQRQFIQKMVGKARDPELKYKEGNQPAVDEEGVIRSPTLPTIGVKYAKVNPFALAKLPKPGAVVVHSCPEDPSFYTECTAYNHSKDGQNCRQSPEKCNTSSYGCFGVLPGFETNLGVIAPPTDTIFGYVYVSGYGDKTKYALYAEAG